MDHVFVWRDKPSLRQWVFPRNIFSCKFVVVFATGVHYFWPSLNQFQYSSPKKKLSTWITVIIKFQQATCIYQWNRSCFFHVIIALTSTLQYCIRYLFDTISRVGHLDFSHSPTMGILHAPASQWWGICHLLKTQNQMPGEGGWAGLKSTEPLALKKL